MEDVQYTKPFVWDDVKPKLEELVVAPFDEPSIRANIANSNNEPIDKYYLGLCVGIAAARLKQQTLTPNDLVSWIVGLFGELLETRKYTSSDEAWLLILAQRDIDITDDLLLAKSLEQHQGIMQAEEAVKKFMEDSKSSTDTSSMAYGSNSALGPSFERMAVATETSKNPDAKHALDAVIQKLRINERANEEALDSVALQLGSLIASVAPDNKNSVAEIEKMVGRYLKAYNVNVRLVKKKPEDQSGGATPSSGKMLTYKLFGHHRPPSDASAVEDMEQELVQVNSGVSSLASKLTDVTMDVNTKLAGINTKLSTVDFIGEQVGQLSADVADVKSRINTTDQLTTGLESGLSSMNTRVGQVRSDVDGLRSSMAQRQQELDDRLMLSTSNVNDALANTTSSVDKVKQELGQINSDVAALKTNIDTTSNIASTTSASVNELKSGLDTIDARVSQVGSNVSDLRSGFDALGVATSHVGDELTTLKRDVSWLGVHMEDQDKESKTRFDKIEDDISVQKQATNLSLMTDAAVLKRAHDASQPVGQVGGDDEEAIIQAKMASAKTVADQHNSTLSTAKNELTSVLDSIRNIHTTYEKTLHPITHADNIKKVQERYDSIIATSDKNRRVSPEEQKLAAEYKTLQEDGKVWVDKVSSDIPKLVEQLRSIVKDIVKTYKTAPFTDHYTDDDVEKLTTLFDGDINASGFAKRGLLSHLKDVATMLNNEYTNAERVYKPIALAVKERASLEKEQYARRDYYDDRRQRGGEPSEQQQSMDAQLDDVGDVLTTIVEQLEGVLRKIVDATNKLKRNGDPVLAAAASSRPPSLFSVLWRSYLDRRAKTGDTVASAELVAALDANGMVPRKALAVTPIDKTVFVFLTLVIRLLALQITWVLIQHNKIIRLSHAVAAYTAVYIALLLVFVAVVNLDLYRMRMLFNYINLHGNTGLLVAHIGLLILISIVMYIVSTNVNPVRAGLSVDGLSEEDKVDVQNRLDLMSMLVWGFMTVLIAVQ